MVLTLYPLIRQADRKPSLMAGLIAGMLLVGIAYLVFAYVYPFPADVDAANLAHGQENGWKLLGATVGFGIAWWLDRRYIHFDTRAVWWVQLLKVVLGGAEGTLAGAAAQSRCGRGRALWHYGAVCRCTLACRVPLYGPLGAKGVI